MASNFSDDARRADILRRAHAGLDEDLDDMRAELMEVLPDYEQRLRRHSDALPTWLDVSAAQVRALFHLRPVGAGAQAQPASSTHGILGPRTVALAAGKIETFIEQGFVDADFDDETRTARLVELYVEISEYLAALIGEARQVAEDAHATLDAWLDAHLMGLEAQRKIDVEALEDLVGQGDIGRGGNARQEIADLWEDQRHRAATLQTHWQPLLALVHEGLEISESGLKELTDLLVRARAGLIGANPALEPLMPSFAWPRAPEAPTHAPKAPPAEIDDAGPTLDLGHPTDHAIETSAHAASQDAFNPPSEPGYAPGIIPLDEPTSEPVTLESSSVNEYSEPAGEEADPPETAEAQPPRSVTQRMYTRADTPSSGHPTAAQTGVPAGRAHTEPTPVDPEDLAKAAGTAAPSPNAEEVTYTQCFRIRPGYKAAGWAEVLGVALPPTIVLGAICALSVLHLLGFDAGGNPFERWPWAVSAVAGSLAWLLLLPALRRWRSKWRGSKLIIMRHTDVREEAALCFDTQTLTLNGTTWRWDRLSSATLRRWDSPADEVCGWSLVISAPDAPTLQLAAPESNRKKWQHSPYQLAETPYDAWQVSPYDFDTISRRAL